MIAGFHCLEDFSRDPNVDKDVVKARANTGWWNFRIPAERPSGPTAFHFDMPLSASAISSVDDSSPGDSSSGRGGKRAMIVGSRSSDFVLNRLLWQNPAHRTRIRTLSRNSVPSSSLVNCSLLDFVNSNPAVLFKNPLWSLLARNLPVSARCPSKCARTPAAITSSRFAHADRGVFYRVLTCT